MESEYEAARIRNDRRKQYVIAPHVRPVQAPDGTVICRRFSCAGMVIESYREIDINLLRTESETLPAVPLECLVKHYPALRHGYTNRSFAKILAFQAMAPGLWFWLGT